MQEPPLSAGSQTRTFHEGTLSDSLSDFRTNWRVLLLSVLAVPIGVIGALVAKALLWLIAVISNLCFFHQLSAQNPLPEHNHLGWWLPAVPIAGALVIGLMAR